MYRLSLRVPEALAEEFADALVSALPGEEDVAGLWEDEDAADGLWIVEAFCADRPDADLVRKALARASEKAGFAAPEPVLEELPDRDWVAESQANLHPVDARRFRLHGSHDRGRRRGGGINIEIDAGMAFGTGHHGTTRGCLCALSDCLDRRAYRRPLDVGCGTGALAIAAAKALRTTVTATDIDPVAVEITGRNSRINEVSALVRGITADGLSHPSVASGGPYDLVMANILAGPLKRLAPDIRKASMPGATIILSGLLTAQEAAVFSAYRNRGFLLERRYRLGEWTTLVLTRT